MPDVTNILNAIEGGDSRAAENLLPLIYDDLRKLAARKMANEKPGQTLSATSLVHEVYIRLVDVERAQNWASRGHFFSAAAEAMRRILIENARRKGREKRGGDLQRVELDAAHLVTTAAPDQLLAIDEALSHLEEKDERAAELVKLRFFAGFSTAEAGDLLGMARTTAFEQFAWAKAWLRCELDGEISKS